MHILIDIGNTTIVIAMTNDSGEMKNIWRFKTLKDETLSFFRYELKTGIRKYGIATENISSITISSVVPEVNDYIAQAIIEITGITPHFFNLADAERFIKIDIESPSSLGKDRLADAVGAVTCHSVPAIVIDMGTATTIGVIDHNKTFIGGMIIPGVKTSLKALSKKASQLPMISIEKPAHIIGRNTIECMQSGILYGNAAMIDGIIDRIKTTLQGDVSIIATGGMARQIIPFCHNNIIVDDLLQLKGLFFGGRI